jgi:hypothetical protein
MSALENWLNLQFEEEKITVFFLLDDDHKLVKRGSIIEDSGDLVHMFFFLEISKMYNKNSTLSNHSIGHIILCCIEEIQYFESKTKF